MAVKATSRAIPFLSINTHHATLMTFRLQDTEKATEVLIGLSAELPLMIAECPRCGKSIPADSVYCPYCGRGIQPSAWSTQVSLAGTLMITFAVASFVWFLLSFRALLSIYNWYPASVAQVWLVYACMLTASTFAGFVVGLGAAALVLTRNRYQWAMVLLVLATLVGGGSWVISMVIPRSNIAYSVLGFFLPLCATSLAGTLLVFSRKEEFNSLRSMSHRRAK
jgi:hypothetical protein